MFVGALTIATLAGAVGGSSLKTLKANAQTPQDVTAENPTNSKTGGAAFNEAKGEYVGANGVKEELLPLY